MGSIKGEINYLIYKILPEKTYLKTAYRYYHKKKLNISSPKRFSEKLFLSKIYNGKVNTDLIRKCYDKYTVREYVIDTIGEKYLAELYGVWDNVDKIDFSQIPNKCVFKVTQSSGYNIICLDRKVDDEQKIRKTLGEWLALQNNSTFTEKVYKFENYYFDQHSKVICEELLELNKNVPEDIRIYCFSGKPEFITVDYESVSPDGIKLSDYYRNVFDLKGNFLNVKFGRENNSDYSFPNIPNLDEMLDVAEKLSKPFKFVRVDLYNINGRIVFGELTWIPQGASGRIEPDEFDLYLGEKFNIV